jgi:2-methylisocitrate lyase-like PEP mutase family enzyme|tara:strand:+ start:1978 stop:2823 length:846 start_codon:yes stop_codon:yes gene_type:complete
MSSNKKTYGEKLKSRVRSRRILPVIGVYDVFSAALAAKKFEAIFCSGYGLSASFYGLPDEGFITCNDMVSFVSRLRQKLNSIHIIVDIDEGYGSAESASTAVKMLEQAGASGLILEDQKRPKKCGHLNNKLILDINEYKERLIAVVESNKDLYVIARTDSSDFDIALERVVEYSKMGADAVLIEGITSHAQIPLIRNAINEKVGIAINLIAGGKTEPISMTTLDNFGINIVNYSTPCLFSAHKAINLSLDKLLDNDGMLIVEKDDIALNENSTFLDDSDKK